MIRLAPMGAAAYIGYWALAVDAYARDQVANGVWPARDAVDRARAEFAVLLPDGLATPHHHLFEVAGVADGATVGFVWLACETLHGAAGVYLYDLQILPPWRGRGHGRRTLEAVRAWARSRGATSIGLHVHARNAAARALYARWGATVTGLNLLRRVDDGLAPGDAPAGACQNARTSPAGDASGDPVTRRRISSGSPFEEQIGYSRAIVDGPWVFVSGTTGFDYATMTISSDVAEQARQCLRNIAHVLAQAGSSLDDVVRVHYVFPDGADAAACFPVFRESFAVARPAATMICAGLLDPRMKIEIEVTARIRGAGEADRDATPGSASAHPQS